ncbi:hypothetical protein JZ751_016195 [Albula glossodonta]|uniref:Ig-like domain-containing protein n=1 Tax=Albula glossodonta TaxID=121402 RepID=A0A8T2N309_9TELE|nr:hypothetical protein JZ751_016195 [Albula glossodonta]
MASQPGTVDCPEAKEVSREVKQSCAVSVLQEHRVKQSCTVSVLQEHREYRVKQSCTVSVLQEHRVKHSCAVSVLLEHRVKQSCTVSVLQEHRVKQSCTVSVLQEHRVKQSCAVSVLQEHRVKQSCAVSVNYIRKRPHPSSPGPNPETTSELGHSTREKGTKYTGPKGLKGPPVHRAQISSYTPASEYRGCVEYPGDMEQESALRLRDLRESVVGLNGWRVTYTPERICALKGSTVDMPCTYSYPRGHSPEDLSQSPQYRGRVEYRGNYYNDCGLRITGLTESDSVTYRFRFLTNYERGKFTGQPGVTLTVTDLQVSVDPDTVTVGQSVTLTCRTTCTLSDSPAFIWYKNRNVITSGNQYSFNLASSDDTDLYSCAVKGYEKHPSPAVSVKCLRAETDSDTVTEGQSVTLTCRTTCAHLTNSKYFRWYKNGQDLSNNKQELQFTASSERAGSYSCDVWDGRYGIGKYLHSLTVTLRVTCFRVDINSHPATDVWRVTMTCNIVCTHMRNSPAFIWYQNGLSLQNTNQKLQFTASSGDTGRYSCTVVTLTCITTCTHLSNSQTFTWYKNGQSLSITNQDLQLTARRGDSGRYSCGGQDGHNHLLSSAVTLNVNYAPKLTSVLVSPSGEIKEGSSVTLTCSSDANPSVQTYTWFKKTGAGSSERGTGESYTFTNISSEDSGQYYCEAQNQHGALSSTAVTVDVQYAPKLTSVSVSPSGEIKEGSSVTLTCSSDANPPVQSYTWYKDNRPITSARASGQNYSINKINISDSGEYYCQTWNGIGTGTSPPKRLDVQYGPKNTSVSVSPSGVIKEGSSANLTCSSDANPPVQRYTWFKKNESGCGVKGLTQGPNSSGVLAVARLGFEPQASGVPVMYLSYYTTGCPIIAHTPKQQNRTIRVYVACLYKPNSQVMLVHCCDPSIGIQVGIVGATAAIAAIVALVFPAVIVWKRNRRRNSLKEAESREEDKEDNKSPVYDDISGTALSHTAAQDTNRDDDEAALYSTVQPANTRNQEESLYCNIQKLNPKTADDVEYASIRLTPARTARSPVTGVEDDAVTYSTIAKRKT